MTCAETGPQLFRTRSPALAGEDLPGKLRARLTAVNHSVSTRIAFIGGYVSLVALDEDSREITQRKIERSNH